MHSKSLRLLLLLIITCTATLSFIPAVRELSSTSGDPQMLTQAPGILSAEAGRDALEQAFDTSGAAFLFRNINSWRQIDRERHSLSELREMAEQVATSLGVLPGADEQQGERGGVTQFRLEGMDGQGRSISILIHNTEETKGYASYLVIDMISNESKDEAVDFQEKVRELYRSYGTEPSISRCIHGMLEEELSPDRIEKLQQTIFQSVKAIRTESLIQDGLISVSGYTPNLIGKVTTGQGDINLQVALRKSPGEGKTLLWVGTPVISLEY